MQGLHFVDLFLSFAEPESLDQLVNLLNALAEDQGSLLDVLVVLHHYFLAQDL